MTASTEMPVQDAGRSSPLSAWPARLAAASATPGRFTIRELPYATQINLRGAIADPAFAGAVRSVRGLDLPARPNAWTGTADCQVIWLGPDEWLVVAADGVNESLVPALRNALLGVHHAVIDVSANRTTIEIAGQNARLVLGKGCPLDLHARSFGPRNAAQTLLAKSQVILQCMDTPSLFRLYVRNSFAQYVAAWITDAAAECSASGGLDTERIVTRLG